MTETAPPLSPPGCAPSAQVPAPLLVEAEQAVALDYAARGWPGLPLHSIRDNRCNAIDARRTARRASHA
jgi:hypothetical protein